MKEDSESQVMGVIIGNREFFPDELSEEGGKEVIGTLKDSGFELVTPFSEDSGKGTVQTREESKECAEMFKEKSESIEGIVVSLPNFGDEKGVSETLRISGLDVPVLVHAFSDKVGEMDQAHRRDSFCGKISVCNNLNQYGINFTDTQKHVEGPSSNELKDDLKQFGRTCRVVKGLKNSRHGTIGVRPNAFKTVRYSEKMLEGEGMSVENINLIEIIDDGDNLGKDSPEVKEKLDKMEDWFAWDDEVPEEAIVKTAKLSAAMDKWAEKNELDTLSIQCWPTIEDFYDITPCAAMSLLSESMLPVSCESDVMGALSMYSLQLASNKPTALVDLNNNYGDNPDKLVLFHCSAFAKSFFEDECELGYHDMQNKYGSCGGRISPGPFTMFRLETNDQEGKIKAYLAEGELTDDELETFGGYGVAKIEDLQSLMKHVTSEGFDHHTAIVQDHVADALEEAIGNYMGWEIYRHNSPSANK